MQPERGEELQVAWMIRTLRRMGWGFFVLGGCGFVYFLRALCDPVAVIDFNHTETADPGAKSIATLSTGAFFIVGAGLAFAPRRILERFLSAHIRRTRRILESFRKDRR
jgi:hypothetical protein